MTATKKQLLPTEGDIMPTNQIENLILDIRGQQVMLDRDLANLYGVDTKVLNQAVKRNIERFPVRFRFQLSDLERDKLVTNFDRLQIKRADKVAATIYTKKPSAQLQLDIQKHNAQYPPINIVTFDRSHDRFLCIDEMVYHLGASIKDLGKKWFAFNRMEMPTTELLQKI